MKPDPMYAIVSYPYPETSLREVANLPGAGRARSVPTAPSISVNPWGEVFESSVDPHGVCSERCKPNEIVRHYATGLEYLICDTSIARFEPLMLVSETWYRQMILFSRRGNITAISPDMIAVARDRIRTAERNMIKAVQAAGSAAQITDLTCIMKSFFNPSTKVMHKIWHCHQMLGMDTIEIKNCLVYDIMYRWNLNVLSVNSGKPAHRVTLLPPDMENSMAKEDRASNLIIKAVAAILDEILQSSVRYDKGLLRSGVTGTTAAKAETIWT